MVLLTSYVLREAGVQAAKYIVVYDVAHEGYRYEWLVAAGLCPVVIGVAVFTLGPRLFSNREMRLRLFGALFTIIGVVWSLSVFASTYGDYARLRDDLANSRYDVIEGVVTDFVPGDERAHRSESFAVNTHRFSYRPSVLIAGFNMIQENGGVIRTGLRVRIAAVDGQIARLEVEAH